MAQPKARPWRDLVTEGRRLVAQEGDVKWALGDLALEVAPLGDDHAHNGNFARLEEFAEEIDIPFNTLKAYRQTAAAWAQDRRISSACWSAHQLTASREDRFEFLRGLGRGGRKITSGAVRVAIGQKPGAHHTSQSSPPEHKAAVVSTYLDDDDTTDEFVGTMTPSQARKLTKKIGAAFPTEVGDEGTAIRQQQNVDAFNRRQSERDESGEPLSTAAKALASARSDYGTALADCGQIAIRLRHIGALRDGMDEAERADIVVHLEDFAGTVALLIAAFAKGGRKFDADLAAFLAAHPEGEDE